MQQFNNRSGFDISNEHQKYTQQLYSNTNIFSSALNSSQYSQQPQQIIPQPNSNKPKCNRKKIYLNQDQTEAIVLAWREKGFGDFNNWIQSSKAEQKCDFIENPLEVGVKTFTCKLEIYFPNYSNVPGFSAIGTGRSKKEAKKLSQERILLEIIKEGYFNLGYKDDHFVEKIPSITEVQQMIILNSKDQKPNLKLTDSQQENGQELAKFPQSFTFDPMKKQLLQSKQVPATQSEINAFYQELSLSGIENMQQQAQFQGNYTVTPSTLSSPQIDSNFVNAIDKNIVNKEKDEVQKKIFKLSKQMQDNLKSDKYFEACQVLVQILSKKAPEWNEINHIWSYALLSKDIVYVKVLLDLIIQKTINKPKVIETCYDQFMFQNNFTNSQQEENSNLKKDEGNIQQKQEDESVEQAKRELIRKYGNNMSRMETDNVYDFFDSYTLIINKPDFENNSQSIKVGGEEDEQESMIKDLPQAHLQQEIEAQIVNNQQINEIIAPFDSQIKSMEKKEVLKEIDNYKRQIEYYKSIQKLEDNFQQINQNTSLQQSQDPSGSQQNNDDEGNSLLPGELPTKKIKPNDESNSIAFSQDIPISEKGQELVQSSEYAQKIQEIENILLKKQKELEKIEEEYQEYLKLQEQRQKQIEQQREQQKQHELQQMTQIAQNKAPANMLSSYYIPQQQQQQNYQYPQYMNQPQQQQPFQYPTMAYNHYDYSLQNSAIFQQQQYYNQYYSHYPHHQGYQYYSYPAQQNPNQVPYPSVQPYANTPYQPYPQQPPVQQKQAPQTQEDLLKSYQKEALNTQQNVTNGNINDNIKVESIPIQPLQSTVQPQLTPTQSQQTSIQPQQTPIQSQQTPTQPQQIPIQPQQINIQIQQTPIQPQAPACQQNINYLKYNLIDEMYDTLLYLGDMNFALTVAELIYSKVKINQSDFLSLQAAHYYSNKKNMLIIELIEYIFQIFNSSKPRLTEAFSSLNGSVQKIGNKFSQEVLLFKPASYEINLDQKIAKKGLLEQRENYSLIAEGEFVMLTSLYQPNNNDHVNLYQDLRSSSNRQYLIQFLNNIANTLYSQPPDVRAFFSKISENGQQIEYALIGYVREISKENQIKLFVLPTPQQTRAISEESRTWKITKLVNKTTYDRTCEALLKFVSTKSVSEQIMNIILTPPSCDTSKIQEMSEKIVFAPNKNTLYNPTLNHSQQNALQYATTRALTLIQGPPGTGKTTTAVQIVQEWCRQSSDPVLACADSNIAVDILHREFIKAGIRACRIGPGSEQKNELMQDPKYRSYIESFKKQQGKNPISAKYMFMKKLIADSQVVCATNVGSMSEYLKDQNFTRVIIDEATQATEMSTIIPLINKASQIVLIGDHKQLPPTVLSSFAQSKGMTISLFERLVKQGIQPKMLMRQYRMHSSISLFPSHQFYNNMLENGANDMQRQSIEGFLWPNKLLRIAFININGEERVSQSSVLNNQEAQVVIEIIVDILKTKKTPLSQIGVITPYDAQKRRIKSEISNLAKISPSLFNQNYTNDFKLNKYPNSIIEVDTVDGYQGMEKDLIIISAVRSNNKGNIGFLKDPRRMNVALTRAKRGLIIVGNVNTLQKDTNWRDFITWVNANKAVIQYGVQNQNSNNINLNLNAYQMPTTQS